MTSHDNISMHPQTPLTLFALETKARAATRGRWMRGEWKLPDYPTPIEGEDKVAWQARVDRWPTLPKVVRTNDSPDGAICAEGGSPVVSGCGCCGSPDASHADAEHIAACSPDAVLGLIGLIRELQVGLVLAVTEFDLLANHYEEITGNKVDRQRTVELLILADKEPA